MVGVVGAEGRGNDGGFSRSVGGGCDKISHLPEGTVIHLSMVDLHPLPASAPHPPHAPSSQPLCPEAPAGSSC